MRGLSEEITVTMALDTEVAEKVMGFKRWRVARTLPVAEGHEGPAPEDPDSVGYVLLTEEEARQKFTPYAWEVGYVRLADQDTPPFRDAIEYVPRYSTRIEVAWPLVERFKMSIYPPLSPGEPWVACAKLKTPNGRGFRGGQWNGEGETAAEAICRAALKAAAPEPSRMQTHNEGETK